MDFSFTHLIVRKEKPFVFILILFSYPNKESFSFHRRSQSNNKRKCERGCGEFRLTLETHLAFRVTRVKDCHPYQSSNIEVLCHCLKNSRHLYHQGHAWRHRKLKRGLSVYRIPSMSFDCTFKAIQQQSLWIQISLLWHLQSLIFLWLTHIVYSHAGSRALGMAMTVSPPLWSRLIILDRLTWNLVRTFMFPTEWTVITLVIP